MRNISERIKRENRVGPIKKKVLLLLFSGLALSCTRSPKQQWRIIQGVADEWRELTRQQIERAISSLYESRLVGVKRNSDGSFTLTLNEKGRKKSLTYNLETMQIPRTREWDGLWRIISFDIPEDIREARDSLRHHLLRLGFFELHQSTFVHAFECKNEIDYIVELCDLRQYVRFITATEIDVAVRLKRFFNIQSSLKPKSP